MTALKLLGKLAERGIHLWVDNNKLLLQYPKGALTPQLRAEIAAYRAEILRLSPLLICPKLDHLSQFLAGELEVPELEKLEL